MSRMKYAVGNIQASWWDGIWIPRSLRKGDQTPAVILCHGAGSSEIDQPTWPTVSKLIHKLTEAGFPVVAGHMGGDTFANDAMSGSAGTSYMNKALDYAVAQTGCAAKAHHYGLSMGAGCGIRWAYQNPSKAKSVVGGIPMTNINYLYDNATVGGVDFRTGVSAAWGVTYPAALPASADLQVAAAGVLSANAIPSLMFYSTDDPYVRTSDVTTFAANSAGTTVSVGTGGHTHAAVQAGENMFGLTDWDGLVKWYIERS